MTLMWRNCRIALILFALTCAAVARQGNTDGATQALFGAGAEAIRLLGRRMGLTWPGNNPGETAHGSNSIRRILDGCVVEENFSGGDAMHLRGRSVSIFDVRAGKWKQTWVDNEGGYLDFTGEFRDGQMILAREATRPDGSKGLQRMVFKNISPDEFDWSWEGSKDGGKTWTVVWPITTSASETDVGPRASDLGLLGIL